MADEKERNEKPAQVSAVANKTVKDKKVEVSRNENIPEFNVGDTVLVNYKITEGDKVRIQPFQGIVIAKKGKGISKTFTVRRIGAGGIGVERIFPLYSPKIESLEIKTRGKVRRAKLYYLRDRIGKAATKVKEKK